MFPDAGVVDEDVEVSEVLEDLGEDLSCLLAAGDVVLVGADVGESFGGELLAEPVHAVGDDVGHGDGDAGAEELADDFAADVATGSGDDGDSVVEGHDGCAPMADGVCVEGYRGMKKGSMAGVMWP